MKTMRCVAGACVLAGVWAVPALGGGDKAETQVGERVIVETRPAQVFFNRPFQTIGGYPVRVRGNRVPDEFGVIRPLRVPDDYDGDPADLPSVFFEEEVGVIRPRGSDRGFRGDRDGRLPLGQFLRERRYSEPVFYERGDEIGVVRPARRVVVEQGGGGIEVLRGEDGGGESRGPEGPQAPGEGFSAASLEEGGVTRVFAADRTIAFASEAVRGDAWAMLNAGYYRDAARAFEAGDGSAEASAGLALATLMLGRLDEAEGLLLGLDGPAVLKGRLDGGLREKLRAMVGFLSVEASAVVMELVGGE